MTLTLRPHQLDAVNAMSDNTKGQVIVPTGGGKTMCMIEDVKKLFRHCLLYTSPSPRDRQKSRMPSSA